MANNCLITKLKEVVENDNLPKLGEIRFYINKISSSDGSLMLSSDSNCIVKTVNGTFKDGTTEYSIMDRNNHTFLFDDEAVISIAPVYDLKVFSASRLSEISLDTSLFKYCKTLHTWEARDSANNIITGKISDFFLSANTLVSLKIGELNNVRHYSIDDVPNFPELKEFAVSNTIQERIQTSTIAEKMPKLYSLLIVLMSGDISNLSFMRNNISSSKKGDINCGSSSNNVTGTVESIVGDDTTTYSMWYRIALPNTVTVTRTTYTALRNANCNITGPTIID